MHDSDDYEYIGSADFAGHEEIVERLHLCLELIGYILEDYGDKLENESAIVYIDTVNWFLDRGDTMRVLDELIALKNYLEFEI